MYMVGEKMEVTSTFLQLENPKHIKRVKEKKETKKPKGKRIKSGGVTTNVTSSQVLLFWSSCPNHQTGAK